MEWYEKIKQERIAKNLTQKQVAEQLKISRVGYTHYENGKREPTFEMLKKICDLFEVSADYIIGRTDY